MRSPPNPFKSSDSREFRFSTMDMMLFYKWNTGDYGVVAPFLGRTQLWRPEGSTETLGLFLHLSGSELFPGCCEDVLRLVLGKSSAWHGELSVLATELLWPLLVPKE